MLLGFTMVATTAGGEVRAKVVGEAKQLRLVGAHGEFELLRGEYALHVGSPPRSAPYHELPGHWKPSLCDLPGWTKCPTFTFQGQCEAADTPGCCHWCTEKKSCK